MQNGRKCCIANHFLHTHCHGSRYLFGYFIKLSSSNSFRIKVMSLCFYYDEGYHGESNEYRLIQVFDGLFFFPLPRLLLPSFLLMHITRFRLAKPILYFSAAFDDQLRSLCATVAERCRTIEHNVWIGTDSNHRRGKCCYPGLFQRSIAMSARGRASFSLI